MNCRFSGLAEGEAGAVEGYGDVRGAATGSFREYVHERKCEAGVSEYFVFLGQG